MNTAELKLKIFREVDSLDKNKLEDIYGLICNRLNENNDTEEWYKLSDTQRDGILTAMNSVEKGDGIPHETIIEKYQKKYGS